MAEGTLTQSERAAPVGVAPAAGGGGWPVVGSLAWRELVRFARQRNRVFGAIGQPILFWILFGAGLGSSFRMPGAGDTYSYSEYFFPGAMTLILLFTAIFATISIIEDRREGFLQGVLVAPISRTAMVLGKVLGGTLIALVQGLVFLVLGLTIGLQFHIGGLLAITAFCFLLAFALTALGFVIAWRMDSTQGFHAVMSVFLMPMWLLSGAFFPAGDGWLGWIMACNPLTYGVAGLRRLLYWNTSNGADAAWLDTLPSMATCLTVTVLFAAVAFALSCWIAGQRTRGDLL